MKQHLLTVIVFLLSSVVAAAAEVIDIRKDWLFCLGEQEDAYRQDFDDSLWRKLTLPHDWAFEQGYSKDGAQKSQGGYACGGIGWYRKHFTLNEHDFGIKQYTLYFEGVYMNSEVWVNGVYFGKRPYGYISFFYNITGALKSGDNVISVRVDNSLEPSARWYHGCGIYGNVYLMTHNREHFVIDGTFVTTPEVSELKSVVSISAELSGCDDSAHFIKYRITDPCGKLIRSVTGGSSMSITIDNPRLWSDKTPYLYRLDMALYNDRNEIRDSQTVKFGIRSVEWVTGKGFYLNGKPTKLKGIAEHLEGGPVGAAWNRELLLWKLNLIKDMGCNAIRSTVKPHVPAFYDICDSLGILVLNELFDGWSRKAEYDYGMQAFPEWWERDLEAFVRRDRNHPCIIAYGAGNETRGKEVARKIVDKLHSLDSTRQVTSGSAEPDMMDIRGMNGPSEKKSFMDSFDGGDRPFLGTETPHTWQVRGFYRTQTWYRDGFPNPGQSPYETPDLTEEEIFGYDWISPEKRQNAKQVFNSSYDNAYVRMNARQGIEAMRDKSWYSGAFRWTGFDYLGEAGYVHGGWPFRAFMSGVIDLAGFPKDHYYLYQSQWNEVLDMVHILPHWTHPRMAAGTEIPVWVYTTGDSAELFLNGKSLGKKDKGTRWDEMQCEWLVPWTPGTIEAVAYRNGTEIARQKVCTAGAPYSLTVTADSDSMRPDGQDYTVLTVSQSDIHGEFYPYGENRVYFKTFGDVTIRSAENGNPTDTETNYGVSSKCTFFGLLRLFVQSGYEDGDKSILLGVISGDKALYSSNIVNIDVREVALDGKLPKRDIQIRYTTDGSFPDMNSPIYKRPFSIGKAAMVKAAVYDGTDMLFLMEEKFGPGEGLYWGTPGEPVCANIGEQAESAVVEYGEIKSDGTLEYVSLGAGNGKVEWYQENDGPRRPVKIWIVYRIPDAGNKEAEIVIYNNGKEISDFIRLSGQQWKSKNMDMRLIEGANYIEIRNIGDCKVDIDKIIIMEQTT